MLRGIAGVIVGYIVMAIMVGLFLTGLWFVLKKEGAYEPGTYDVTMTWCVGALALGFIAAIIGGVVCRKVGGTDKANFAMAVIVVVLGGVVAGLQYTKSQERIDTVEEVKDVIGEIRDGDMLEGAVADAKFAAGEMGKLEEMSHAMKNAEEPLWVSISNAIIGAIGVLLGGKLVGGGKTSD